MNDFLAMCISFDRNLILYSGSEGISRLEELRRFSSEIELIINTKKLALDKSFKEKQSKLTEDDFDNGECSYLHQMYHDDCYWIETAFIGIYRKSFVISLYSILETSMDNICKHLEEKNKYKIQLNELSGKGIKRASLFLKQLAKVDFNRLNTEWTYLTGLNTVRNCLSHCEGDIKSFNHKEKILFLVKKYPTYLTLDNER